MENADDASDPFASLIIPNCKPTSSQEEKLQVCHFARELEVFQENSQSSSASDEASEQATGIIMVSLPDSSDDYQTPPEQQPHSENSSHDGQVLPTKTAAIDREIEDGGGGDGEAMVLDAGSELEAQRTVDLTKDSDNLGFSEKSPRVPVEGDDTVMVDIDTDEIGVENGVNEIETEIGATEVVVTEFINSPTGNTQEVFVEMPVREQEESVKARKSETPKKNIDDIDKFRYLSTGGKRELPSSMKGQERNSEGDDCHTKRRVLLDVLDHALKLLVGLAKDGGGGEDDGDSDFLETAKTRGLTFSRPRWWPPEGFED